MERFFTCAVLMLSLLSPAYGAPAKKAAARPAKPAASEMPKPVDPRLTPPADKLDLKDDDTIVFLGDSITHQCLYTQYVEDYLYTRFPKAKLRLHNAGVGGDRASDALDRFDLDVAPYKPKYVTILLGMNDGGYKQWDAATFDTYQKDMLKLLDRIKEIGATAIVMGPTMYDRDAILIKQNPKRPFDSDASKYYNGVLAYYGTFMRDQALERGLNYVDMFAPLNKLSIEQRMKDPNFTMIPDAIHPDPNGQVVMAVSLIEASHLPHPVATTAATLDPAKGWKVTVTGGGKATDIQGDAEHLSFTSLEPCIPWILPPDAAVGYQISIAGHHFSSEPLRVQGLKPGKYDLKIDGQSIGTFQSSLLASKVELQKYDKCPQYQQSLAVATLNKEKNDKAMHPIRNLYSDLKKTRKGKDASPESLAAFIEQMKPKVAELEKSKADYEQKISELAQPKPHKFELTRAGA